MWRPRFVMLTTIAAFILFTSLTAPRRRSLDPFVDQHLKGLTEAAKTDLNNILGEYLPERFCSGNYYEIEPINLWRYPSSDGSLTYALFEARWQLIVTPSEYPVAIHVISSKSKLVLSSEFSIGWRINLETA